MNLTTLLFVASAAKKLIQELEVRFPSASLMDAFGLVYPQYWMGTTADEDFQRHLDILKEHYGHTKEFNSARKGKHSTSIVGPSSKDAVVPASETHTTANKDSDGKQSYPVLSISKLDEQATMFKIAMKGNCHAAMQGDLPLNPLTRLWRRIEANSLLRHKLSEYLKIAELAVVTVLGSVEDERTFSTLSFMKNKLRNRLSTHLPLVVGMHAQDFFGLSDFPYDAAYEEWRSKSRKEDS